MLVRITFQSRVTLPEKVLEELGVRPGDHFELRAGSDGYMLTPPRQRAAISVRRHGRRCTEPGHVQGRGVADCRGRMSPAGRGARGVKGALRPAARG